SAYVRLGLEGISSGFLPDLEYSHHSSNDPIPTPRTNARAVKKENEIYAADWRPCQSLANRLCRPNRLAHMFVTDQPERPPAFCPTSHNGATPLRISNRDCA